jgi:hypothetical protein
MNCRTFKAVVQDIDCPGAVEETMREDALTHAESCLRCARRLQRTRALAAALEALARADESEQAPPSVEDQVRLAFWTKTSRRLRPSRVTWAIAAAAALAIAFGAGLLWHRTVAPGLTGRPGQGSGLSNDRAAAIPAPAASQPDSRQAVKPKPSRRTPTSHGLHHRPVQHAPAAPRQPEVLPGQEMAGFLPLPFADREEPLGAGAVVRIQLSEASLGLLGVPVTEPASSQPVTADVVLGQDGTARAIRFVSGPLPSGLGQQLQSMAFESKGAQ